MTEEAPAGGPRAHRGLLRGRPAADREACPSTAATSSASPSSRPGVTTDRTPQQGASATSGLSFGGQRARSNNIMVDGLDNNDPIVGAVRATFSQEAIREFQVLTNSYSAEFGKASGGVVNIVTKSGTNELHGNAFFYFRDESLNAKDHFEKFDVFGSAGRPRQGALRPEAVGRPPSAAPSRKDKTFFFLSFEKARHRRQQLRQHRPARRRPCCARTGSRWSWATCPTTSRPRSSWPRSTTSGPPTTAWSLRGNYADTTNENIEPFGGIVARSRGAVQLRTDWAVSASQTDILSPRWVNEARVQFARQDQKINSLDPNCGGPCDSQRRRAGRRSRSPAWPASGRQRFTPQPRTQRPHPAHGHAQLLRRAATASRPASTSTTSTTQSTALPLHFGGRYIFQLAARPMPGASGCRRADLPPSQALSARPARRLRPGLRRSGRSYRYKDVSLFVQDEWRVTRKLTLKPGLRYQRQFWPTTSDYTVSNVGGTPLTYDFPQDNNNFAPRVAVAFDPTGSGKTSLHAAYGLFYDNQIIAIAGRSATASTAARTACGRWSRASPPASPPGARPATGSRSPPAPYPEPGDLARSRPGDARTRTRRRSGFDRALGADLFALRQLRLRARQATSSAPSTTTRSCPPSAPDGGPTTWAACAGTSASVLQYTSFGETWYKGLTVALSKRFSQPLRSSSPRTRSPRRRTTPPTSRARSSCRTTGAAANPADPTGLPLGFDSDSERGPATHDQRHRFVVSGLYQFPWDVQLSTIVTAASGRPFNAARGRRPQRRRRRRRLPVRPRAAQPRRSREQRRPQQRDHAGPVHRGRAAEQDGSASARRAALDVIVEAFNLLDRTNFSEINNIFGRGAFPGQPQRDAQGRVTYGLYEQALPPRQIQLAAKVSF